MYHFVLKKHPIIKYGIAILCIALGIALILYPIVGKVLLVMGLGFFFPNIYKKLIGRHVKTAKIEKMLNYYKHKLLNAITKEDV